MLKIADRMAKLRDIAWYEYNGSPQFTFYLVNGPQHVLLSGHKPSNLRKGKSAPVGLDEAQQIRGERYRNARGATVDAGGFSIVATNPPIARSTSRAARTTRVTARAGRPA